jgi:hypothetical protein
MVAQGTSLKTGHYTLPDAGLNDRSGTTNPHVGMERGLDSNRHLRHGVSGTRRPFGVRDLAEGAIDMWPALRRFAGMSTVSSKS